MPNPPRMLLGTRMQMAIVGIVAAGLAVGGFQTGRRSVNAAALNERTAETRTDAPSPSSRPESMLLGDHGHSRISEIATVPFSELYDVLRSASREQLLAWARDLERMPRGPRQRAAVAAYYKSLIQVDHRAAIEALFQAENLNMRDHAIDALLKAAPESIWGDLAEMMVRLPYPGRGAYRVDVIWNWSRVDPEAVSKFIESHPTNKEEDRRLFSLLCSWPNIDPTAAREWLEADASRQTEDAFRAFVTSWADVDPAAAINYAVANATRPNLQKAINDLAYQFMRLSKDDATKLLLVLPAEQAKAAMGNIAHLTSALLIGGVPEGYQRPFDEVANWTVSLPVEFWRESIGDLGKEWLDRDATAATGWFNQLSPERREVAIVSFCRVAESESVEQVMTLGSTINDRSVRDNALGEFARRLGTERNEAMEAIGDLPISEKQKAYLRTVMPEDSSGR
jgi:hypothetical protein